uniref:Uncharacterized protein n=1 Tax=Anguilla anguilla TaxID=7936 RepID=A0A0E9X3K5_ANGAN
MHKYMNKKKETGPNYGSPRGLDFKRIKWTDILSFHLGRQDHHETLYLFSFFLPFPVEVEYSVYRK